MNDSQVWAPLDPNHRTNEFPPAHFDVESDDDEEALMQLIVWAISGMFVLIAIGTSMKLIRNHLRHFSKPTIQRKIIGILWMVPIYATDSWLSLRFKVKFSLLCEQRR